ncbi:hypothetical protein Cgig2_000154 [Carnegiea gigantea]|uniref:Leucine-rich repeat-containing N-terminal plant-type domain-containing protein n=1 Tax=Carnegiea gigantea TaxID=171969 RepID=A0A9Q1Q681_9CARY|nr:hypothetical protein Cgig2_000154 [Carnegiea gigantea]
MRAHSFLIWASILSCYVSMYFVLSQCPNDQKSLLLELRNTLDFDRFYSTKLVTWNESTGCCLWNGITCDPSNGSVIGLDLSHEGIQSGIDNSSSLFRIQSLQRLSLACNFDMKGPIPSALGRLSDLTYLNLSKAGFTGQVPIEISYLVRLLILDISSDFVPLLASFKESLNLTDIVKNLTELRELYVDGVDISANGKEWCDPLLSFLPHLKVLSMSYCNLTGEIPSSLANLQTLSVICLSGNDLSGSLPESLATLGNLRILSLRDCGLTGTVSGKIFQMPMLTTLDLSYNHMLQGMLPIFPQNNSLQTLVFSFIKFSEIMPKSMGNLKSLQKLDISYCSFHGIIPSSISSLSELEYFDLSSNNFSGPIPSFSSSKNLRELHLSSNTFNGSITSTEWGGLLDLTLLDSSNNSLTGDIPSSLFDLLSLETMQMDHNKFSGQLNEFGSKVLITLDLSSNNLEGPLPKSIFQLRDLKHLDLSGNRFNGTLQLHEIVHPLKNLIYLDLSNNSLSVDTSGTSAATNSPFPQLLTLRLASCSLQVLPQFLRTQAMLAYLDLSNNQIQGTVPRWIWGIGGGFITFLNLSCNNFVDLERPIPHIQGLGFLDLHSNNLQGEIPSLIEGIFYLDWSNNSFTSMNPNIGNNLDKAEFFSIARNDIHGRIPTSLCNATNLQVLDLEDNHFKGTIPDCLIARNQNLVVLNARGNNLNGEIPDVFQKTCMLETLDLNGNFLRGRIPRSLVHCKELRVLNLGNNQLNDIFPCQLKRLSKLQVLILRSNKFSGSIACQQENSIWPSLQILDIAMNHFTGELKVQYILRRTSMMAQMNEFQSEEDHLQYQVTQDYNYGFYQDTVAVSFKGNDFELQKILRIFTSLDLSNNAFHGEIPKELGRLNALIVLNLSHNSLSGNIPSSFRNLSQLESLNLSCNSLSGDIPQELTKLSFLESLNLSFNQLTGPIPTSTQLQSFDASSYEGNPGLYGPLLTPSSRSKHAPGLTPPMSLDRLHWSSKNEVEWMLRGAEVGFPVGLTIFIGPLLYIKRWRRWYCKHLEILGRPSKARRKKTQETESTETLSTKQVWRGNGHMDKLVMKMLHKGDRGREEQKA